MFEIGDSAEMIAEVGTSLQLVVIDLSLFVGSRVTLACAYGRCDLQKQKPTRGNRCIYHYHKVEGFR